MSKIVIEKIGGLAGFGLKNSKLQSKGEIDFHKLSDDDKGVINKLFSEQENEPHPKNEFRDTFRYRITLITPEGKRKIETDEKNIPAHWQAWIKDQII